MTLQPRFIAESGKEPSVGILSYELSVEQRRIAVRWLSTFGKALERKDYRCAAGMMHADGYWRDLLTFGWDFKTVHGVDAVESWLRARFDLSPAHDFRLEGEPTIGVLGDHKSTQEFFYRFETRIAIGRGFVRLVQDPNSAGIFKAITLLTAMRELKAFPEATGRNRPRSPRAGRSNADGRCAVRKLPPCHRLEQNDGEPAGQRHVV